MEEEGTLPEEQMTRNTFQLYKNALMLHRTWELPARIEITNAAHVYLAERVLKGHPRAEEKIGCGIQGFFMHRSIVGGDDICRLYVRRADGSEADFSYNAAYGKSSRGNKGGKHITLSF